MNAITWPPAFATIGSQVLIAYTFQVYFMAVKDIKSYKLAVEGPDGCYMKLVKGWCKWGRIFTDIEYKVMGLSLQIVVSLSV